MPTPQAAQPTPATQRGVRLRSWMRSLTLLALITNTAGSLAPVAAQSADDMCANPGNVSGKWRDIKRSEAMMSVPSGYGTGYSDADLTVYTSGQRSIAVFVGNQPTMLTGSGAQINFVSRCQAVISGKEAEIVLQYAYDLGGSFDVHSLSASLTPGKQYVYAARWPGAIGGRDFTIWIVANDQKMAKQMRNVFWTVKFPDVKPAEASAAAGAPGTHADSTGAP